MCSIGRMENWILPPGETSRKQTLAFGAALDCTFPHIGFIGGLQLNPHPSFPAVHGSREKGTLIAVAFVLLNAHEMTCLMLACSIWPAGNEWK
jgi:hypothetical protein